MEKDRLNINNRKIKVAAEGIIIFTVLLCFASLLRMVLTGNISWFDDSVRNAFYGIRAEWLTPIVKIITYMANWETVTVICLCLLLCKKTSVHFGIPAAAGALFISLFNKLLKAAVQRPRPDDVLHLVSEGGFSFPSGHSITSMFFYGMLIYLVRTYAKDRKTADILSAVLAVPMLLVGPSRIYLGVHYPSDVLAGWCLAIAFLMIFIIIKEYNDTGIKKMH